MLLHCAPSYQAGRGGLPKRPIGQLPQFKAGSLTKASQPSLLGGEEVCSWLRGSQGPSQEMQRRDPARAC